MHAEPAGRNRSEKLGNHFMSGPKNVLMEKKGSNLLWIPDGVKLDILNFRNLSGKPLRHFGHSLKTPR